jgi:hypothetical protein
VERYPARSLKPPVQHQEAGSMIFIWLAWCSTLHAQFFIVLKPSSSSVHPCIILIHCRSPCGKAMRPEKAYSGREQLPPPFNRPGPVIKRRASDDRLTKSGYELKDSRAATRPRRRNSTLGALDRPDRRVNWLRFIHGQQRKKRRENGSSAVEKLKK